MKVLVIGLGSMGKRRIRLLQKHASEIEIFGLDTNEGRRDECKSKFSIETFDNLENACKKSDFDCAFICTSPLSHSKIINQCLNLGMHIFSELNLVDDMYDENILLAEKNKLVLFLSSTLLYREDIIRIGELAQKTSSPLNYTYHIGQYLPDWHPWENYKDFFIGEKRSNGCREIFAIDLPWLIEVFGTITGIQVIKSKITDLNIDYNDNYLLLVQHEGGNSGALAVDVVSRKAVRNLEVFGEQLYLHWDGEPSGLFLYDYDAKTDINIAVYDDVDKLDNYSNFVVENAYSSEIAEFFKVVSEGKIPKYSFEKDKEILKIIDRIEA